MSDTPVDQHSGTPRAMLPHEDVSFIYGLVDPLEPGHVRYVGMATRAKRPFEHSTQVYRPCTNPSHFTHWVQKLHSEGREYSVLILESLPKFWSHNLVGQIEVMYINSLRRIGHNLTNTAPGGYHCGSGNHTPETKQKIASSMKGMKRSVETRAKVGIASASRVKTVEWRAKISASLKGHKRTLESLGKQSATLLGHKDSPETIAKRVATRHRNLIKKLEAEIAELLKQQGDIE